MFIYTEQVCRPALMRARRRGVKRVYSNWSDVPGAVCPGLVSAALGQLGGYGTVGLHWGVVWVRKLMDKGLKGSNMGSVYNH